MDVNNVKEIINSDQDIKESIGTKQEKTVHQFLKYYISPDSKFHEIAINKNIVDVLIDNHIYEIQTRNFNVMRNKLSKLLPEYKVTIVYPVSTIKMLHKIDENGVLVKTQKSPRPDKPVKICSELYKISDYLLHPNLNFKIVCLSVDEFQTTRINKYKQTRLTHIDSIPKEIVDVIDLNNSKDFLKIIPDIDMFTSKEFGKHTRLGGRNLSSALLALRKLNVIEVDHIEGKKYIYKKVIK